MVQKRTDADVTTDAIAVLESLTGSVEAPTDWSAEHDHYLYGTPKRENQRGNTTERSNLKDET
jgi:hypothetical protein